MVYPEELEQLAREAIAPLMMTLTNDVHQIVGPERFEASFPYARILLCARLVTRPIESPAALWFLCAFFFGIGEDADLSATDDPTCKTRERCGPPPGIGAELDEATQAAVREQLLLMAPWITYRVVDDLGKHAAECRQSSVDWHDVACGGSTIYLARKTLERCMDPNLTEEERTFETITLAATVVHELGHAALTWVVHPSQSHFFRTASSLRSGLSWSATSLDLFHSTSEQGFPVSSISISGRIGVLLRAEATRSTSSAGTRRVYPCWSALALSLADTARSLLTDDFRETTVPTQGAKALVALPIVNGIQQSIASGTRPPVFDYVSNLFTDSKTSSGEAAIAVAVHALPALQLRKSLSRQRYEREYPILIDVSAGEACQLAGPDDPTLRIQPLPEQKVQKGERCLLEPALTNGVHPIVARDRFESSFPTRPLSFARKSLRGSSRVQRHKDTYT